MAGITLEKAQAKLDAYLAAEEAAISNKSYTIDGRSFTRQDLDAIREGIKYWNSWVESLENGSSRSPRIRLAEV